jgi:glutaminyl-peptide cyclotransferase
LNRKVARACGAIAWLAVCASCERAQDPPAAAPAPAAPDAPARDRFDGERAFRDLVEQVRHGPRHPGSPGSEAVRELIRSRSRQAGWAVQDHAFEAELPGGTRSPMLNVIADLPGADPGVVMLVTHYDTKQLPRHPEFAGANDGASGVAVLLELARVLPQRERALSHRLVFFDGEEAVGPNIRGNDGLYGSRALAERMREDGSLAQLRALILIDMVGDSDLNVSWGSDSDPRLATRFAELAQRAGLALAGPMGLVDDHTPFVAAGVRPVLSLIDFHFGERASPGWRWHTSGDTLESVSAASLDRFGGVLVEFLAAIEPELARPAGASAP